jgi:hypothetical protein
MKTYNDMTLEEIAEKINKTKVEESRKEFDELYSEYKKTVEEFSGGLVSTDKAEFIKMYAFYASVIYPDIVEMWESYLGRKLD